MTDRPPAVIIDGNNIAEHWLRDIASQVSALGAPPHLAAVCVRGDSGLEAFVRLKQKAALKCGIMFSSYFFGADDEAGVRQTLQWLADDDSVHGIFVELPLPQEWDHANLLSLVPADKDVDRITPEGERAFYDDTSPVLPPAVAALDRLLRLRGITVRGLSAAVVGAGMLVGRPVAHWLRREGADVSVIDIDTPEPAGVASRADLIVCGAGVPGLVTGEWVKEGAVVVDFGYAKKGDTYVGDVDADSVKQKAGLLTPVPGGMGPLVVAATLENLVTLATR